MLQALKYLSLWNHGLTKVSERNKLAIVYNQLFYRRKRERGRPIEPQSFRATPSDKTPVHANNGLKYAGLSHFT